ncbi:hypothetical protein, partial [Amycolatopsis sp. NPDC059657]|uniref:hypothetical protein n=1 Tax=Amycolatopsis sp. NPDC059657 TaxID=3346899 RepID=UPI003672C5A7
MGSARRQRRERFEVADGFDVGHVDMRNLRLGVRATTGIDSAEDPVHGSARIMRRLIDDRIRQRRSRNLKRGVTQRPERPHPPRQPRPDIPPDLAQRTRQTLRHTTQRTTDRT